MLFPSVSLSMIPPLLLHSLVSLLSLLLPSLLHLPSLSLHSLHTYIHPDSTPSSSSSLRAAIRRPNQDPSHSHRSSKSKSQSQPQTQFDESKAQLFRLRLSHPHLSTRLFFPLFRLSFLLSLLSLSNLALHPFTLSSPIPFLSSLLSLLHLSYSLLALSLPKSAHPTSLHHSIPLAALAGFFISFFIASADLFHFLIPSPARPALAALAAFLSAVLFSPAARAARSFWLGTDQLRWNLSVVSCGPIDKLLLYLSAISVALAPLLWFNPLASADVISGVKRYNVGVLFGSAVLQVLAFRPNLQTYLNEAVLCWYERLHSSRAPDMDYGRAKVFLHNHYVCLAALQFFGPPVMVMVLIGLSQMRGNLLSGVFLLGGLAEFSDAVKECALFLAWWVVFVQGALMMSNLALYRMGFLLV